MSTPRRRRWIEVLRRTAGVSGDGEGRAPTAALDDAALWAAHERASASLKESGARAERVAATVARQRAHIEGAAERASLVAARSEGLSTGAARVSEAFERLGVVALNAGLEGARAGELQGRALLLLSEEIRANVVRGADAAAELGRAVDEIASESAEVRRQNRALSLRGQRGRAGGGAAPGGSGLGFEVARRSRGPPAAGHRHRSGDGARGGARRRARARADDGALGALDGSAGRARAERAAPGDGAAGAAAR